MGQKLAAYDTQGNITGFYDSMDSPAPGGVATLEISEKEWQACLSAPGFKVVGNALVAPTAPSDEQLLAQAKEAQEVAITSACQTAILAGFTSAALGAPHTYPAQVIDQQNLAASVLASLMPNLSPDWVTPFWCADASGNWSYANHTAAQIQQAGQDGKAAIVTAIQRKAALVAQIRAAATVEAAQAIVWG